MTTQLIDLADPAVRRTIMLAKKRGYVTRNELNQIPPHEEFSSEQVQDIVEQLSKVGIIRVETAPETHG